VAWTSIARFLVTPTQPRDATLTRPRAKSFGIGWGLHASTRRHQQALPFSRCNPGAPGEYTSVVLAGVTQRETPERQRPNWMITRLNRYNPSAELSGIVIEGARLGTLIGWPLKRIVYQLQS
jgi:hypothetical protein